MIPLKKSTFLFGGRLEPVLVYDAGEVATPPPTPRRGVLFALVFCLTVPPAPLTTAFVAFATSNSVAVDSGSPHNRSSEVDVPVPPTRWAEDDVANAVWDVER